MLWTLALRNLLRNPRRSMAILVTVAVGTGSLFIFHGFNEGVMNQYREFSVRSRYGHGQINKAGYMEKVFEKPWEHWITDWPQLEQNLKQVAPGAQLFPRVSFFALLTNGNVTVSGRGQGVVGPEEATFFQSLNVVQGQMLNAQPNGILLGMGLARALDAKVGGHITVLANTIDGSFNGTDLEVVGIFHNGQKDFDDSFFRIPLAQAHTLLNTDRIESVSLGLRDIKEWDHVAQSIVAQHPDLEATSFAVLDEVYYQHSINWLNSQFNVIQFIILSVVLLGIFNTVSVGVLERKQEIGNLRANGDSKLDILKLLAVEGTFVGILGGLLGVALVLVINNTVLRDGILMPPAPGLTRVFHAKIELQPLMALKTFLMGSFTTLFGTLLASLRVVRLPIGDALRST